MVKFQILLQNGNISSDMTIAAAWESGLSGAGITIAVIGDGVELSHPDLTDNTVSSLLFKLFTVTLFI